MSVINKMLRDLDQRQAVSVVSAPSRDLRTGIERDTLIVTDVGRVGLRRKSPRALTITAAVVTMVALGVGGWYLRPGSVVNHAQVPANAPVATLDQRPVVIDMAVPVVAVPARQKAPELPSATAKVTVAPAGSSPRNTVVGVPVAVKSPPTASQSLPVPVPVPPAAPVPAPPPAAVVPVLPRQSPALEALAQARTMWNAGAREAAIDLLRDALLVAERSPAAVSGHETVLASLARELARMELAEGRVSQVLAMLTRLEPALSGMADVWALRGNAAQRLGRHQESATAYLMALKLRPDEPRWLLGAAVSLAAQGQLDAAAELAEKARTAGALSPEVTTYLKQLGVRLRER